MSLPPLLLVGRASGLRSAVHTEFMRRRNVGCLGIQQTLMIGSQPQFDQRTRVGCQFGLPAVRRLVAGDGVAGGLVPSAGRPTAKVMFPNEGALDLHGALLIDPALAVGAGSALPVGFPGIMGGRMCPGELCVLGFWLGCCGRRRRASHQRQHQKNASKLRYAISDRQQSPQRKSYSSRMRSIVMKL